MFVVYIDLVQMLVLGKRLSKHLFLLDVLIKHVGVLPFVEAGFVVEVDAGVVGSVVASFNVSQLVGLNKVLAVCLTLAPMCKRTLPHLLVKPFLESSNQCQVLPLLLSLYKHELIHLVNFLLLLNFLYLGVQLSGTNSLVYCLLVRVIAVPNHVFVCSIFQWDNLGLSTVEHLLPILGLEASRKLTFSRAVKCIQLGLVCHVKLKLIVRHEGGEFTGMIVFNTSKLAGG
jgi:hypothetical protein